LSIEIYIKAQRPLNVNYALRRKVYHTVANLSALIITVVAIGTRQIGISVLDTCLVRADSPFEFIFALPLFFHFPVSLGL
jgi:uncharacterized membrane protein